MPDRKPLWWKLYGILSEHFSQGEAADLADTIWLLFRRKL